MMFTRLNIWSLLLAMLSLSLASKIKVSKFDMASQETLTIDLRTESQEVLLQPGFSTHIIINRLHLAFLDDLNLVAVGKPNLSIQLCEILNLCTKEFTLVGGIVNIPLDLSKKTFLKVDNKSNENIPISFFVSRNLHYLYTLNVRDFKVNYLLKPKQSAIIVCDSTMVTSDSAIVLFERVNGNSIIKSKNLESTQFDLSMNPKSIKNLVSSLISFKLENDLGKEIKENVLVIKDDLEKQPFTKLIHITNTSAEEISQVNIIIQTLNSPNYPKFNVQQVKAKGNHILVKEIKDRQLVLDESIFSYIIQTDRIKVATLENYDYYLFKARKMGVSYATISRSSISQLTNEYCLKLTASNHDSKNQINIAITSNPNDIPYENPENYALFKDSVLIINVGGLKNDFIHVGYICKDNCKVEALTDKCIIFKKIVANT